MSGISGKAEIEEDEEAEDTALAESSRKALVEVLGVERRDRILAALYLARQDAVNVVRQSSVHIWKALVHNTPRTGEMSTFCSAYVHNANALCVVREILPELIQQIIFLLTSDEMDQSEVWSLPVRYNGVLSVLQTAARTVTEICRKSSEKLLSEAISILRTASTSSDPRKREGVCLMLCELMWVFFLYRLSFLTTVIRESTTDNQREGQEDEIIAMVRASLVDDESNVRSAAAKAFDTLQEHIGARAIDETIPTLLEALRQPGQSSGTALQALKEVMAVSILLHSR